MLPIKGGDKYSADGVDVAEGDSFSDFCRKVCSGTEQNSPYVEVKNFSDHFRGPRGFRLKNLPDGCYQDVAPDGIGTKVAIITAALSHMTAGCDVMAMTAGDITRWGGLPVLFSNVLDVATLGKLGGDTNNYCRELIFGLAKIAFKQHIVLYRGETAELGICVGGDNPEAVTKFNWAGFAVGILDEKRIIRGDTLQPGHKVMALREHGFRSNGISSVRKALQMQFGNGWFNNPTAKPAIAAAAVPSIMYDAFLTDANGWNEPDYKPKIKMHLIAHLSGGSIKTKLGEDLLFSRGFSAQLEDLWEPPGIMKNCAKWREMSDRECYETWNGGQGALVVIDANDTSRFIKAAREFGIQARECGTIFESSIPKVIINSKFSEQTVEFSG